MKLPIDYAAIARKTGVSRGKICRSTVFGWGVYDMAKGGFVCIKPPVGTYKISNGHWLTRRTK